jgi:hypothetical protein
LQRHRNKQRYGQVKAKMAYGIRSGHPWGQHAEYDQERGREGGKVHSLSKK